jgi:predicted Zn-dependent protease
MCKSFVAISLALALSACATSPTGRKQIILISESQMAQMGLTAFEQMKVSDRISKDQNKQRYIDCVTSSLVNELPPEWKNIRAQTSSGAQTLAWEAQLFNDKTPNAFALPGGKVGVHTGLLVVADTPARLAAVIGHEIAHVMSKHASERVSEQMVAQVGIAAAGAYVGRNKSPEETKQLMGLLGVGAQVGVLLPFARDHESEADLIGQNLMAKAGYDPLESVTLWQRMNEASTAQGRPPEWMSTHPDPEKRMQRLTKALEKNIAVYEATRTAGKTPSCSSPAAINKTKSEDDAKPSGS